MQVKCEYCGSFISDKDEFCSQCGAVNSSFKRVVDETPKTISELEAWYKSRNLPPKEVTRFFIGENYTGAKAFGIYEENGEFIVYKNKDDGSRAIRYSGKDEAYAVNELYLRLKSEILNQKAHNINNKSNGAAQTGSKFTNKFNTILGFVMFGGVMLFIVVGLITSLIDDFRDEPYRGNYYRNGDDIYYCNSYVDDDWYWYDYDTEDYIPVNLPGEMYDDIQSYKYSDGENWDVDIERFEDTETGQYVSSLNESSDSDSDYSWDSSDSWDSDSSDWGSDW